MKNVAASVKQRLLNFNRSQAQPEEFQKLLGRYALERLLYRLSLSRSIWFRLSIHSISILPSAFVSAIAFKIPLLWACYNPPNS
ncbi:hypothetical protein [Chroococcidiopsis cubana]|uniref:hypothetical protein n=1 Tax=Chroococcidiopsis cubana TaxID=171392 RepID=UPI000F8D882A|nr:hypothetical protein [Chroococcidiopsis cubana]